MSTNAYKNVLNTRTQSRQPTPQSQVIPGRENDMAQNNQGGVSFVVDNWTRLDRFLILGTEGGSYYASQKELTLENAKSILQTIQHDGVQVVDRVVEISHSGRAPKNDPALFVLALVMTHGDVTAKQAAYAAVPKVARIGTHMFHLAEYLNGMRGWGRGVRNAFGSWYNLQTPMHLALQMEKYANRDGWTHGDILRLAHPKPATPDHNFLFARVLDKAVAPSPSDEVGVFLDAVAKLKSATTAKEAVDLIIAHKLPRELVPTQLLTEKKVWEALLPHMGMEAMLRNVATMTRVGLISANSTGARLVLDKMSNMEAVKKSRIHPVKVLAALMTYKAGRSVRGSNTWTSVRSVVDGMDDLFYAAFGNVTPTNKRTILGLDVSSSMTWGDISGIPGFNPRVASAALAMVTMRVEKEYEVIAFSDTIKRLDLSAKMSLDEVCNVMNRMPFGGTDCSLPMVWALKNKIPADAFMVYTDSETGSFGGIHPSQALLKYRQQMGIQSKLVVAAMLSNGFSIADPNDGGMLDVVGFDMATPELISDFVRG